MKFRLNESFNSNLIDKFFNDSSWIDEIRDRLQYLNQKDLEIEYNEDPIVKLIIDNAHEHYTEDNDYEGIIRDFINFTEEFMFYINDEDKDSFEDLIKENSFMETFFKIYDKEWPDWDKIEESLQDKVQYGVHQFSTESIIFRGTEEECIKYIDDRPELWDDAEVYFMTPEDPHYLEESIYSYQTWIRPIQGEKQPSKTLTYGSDVILTRSPYSKEVFGKDWKRHIAKIVEWCKDNNPGLIRLTYDFRSNNFNDPNSNEAFIAAIEDKISNGEYLLQHSLTEDMKYYPQDYDKIDLEYEDLEFTQVGNQRDVDDWDEWDRVVNWIYEVDKEDVYQFIFNCMTQEDFPDSISPDMDPNNEEEWKLFVTWLDDNFDDMFTKYKDEILDNWKEEAIEDAQENYNHEDYIDWDSMPGGHDDYRFDESIDKCNEHYDSKTRNYSYSRAALDMFCDEVDLMIEEVCRRNNINPSTAHLQDLSNP